MFDLFASGLKLKDQKITSGQAIEVMPPPNKVHIPFSQHQGSPARPIVGIGDRVKTGAVIAEAQGFTSTPVHASISGTVTAIQRHHHPVLGHGLACTVEADESGEWENSAPPRQSYENISIPELLRQIKEAGLAGLGGGAFPTHVKLTPPADIRIDTLLINGCECEPMLTGDYRLMLEYPVGILEGAKIFQKILGDPKLVFVLEDNKTGAAHALEKEGAVVRIIKARYPAGQEKLLIKSVLRRTVPVDKLPWHAGCVVQNIATCHAAFQAVRFGKPLIERVITVTGEGIREPKNIMVRIGTPLADIVNFCGGYAAKPRKIIFGGPMMGITQFAPDVPVIKCTTGIIVKLLERSEPETACVRCARCVDVCPMKLTPCEMVKYIRQNEFNRAEDLGMRACIECGCCAYVCPAKIPLVHYFEYGKSEIRRTRS
jgi:electron transport complex protein RnfC